MAEPAQPGRQPDSQRPSPDADAAAEHDRDLDEVQVVDEPRGKEVDYDGGAAVDPDVLAGAELVGGHDLRADVGAVALGEGVVVSPLTR